MTDPGFRIDDAGFPGCPPGYVWNAQRQKCVKTPGVAKRKGRRRESPVCPEGFRWSAEEKRCIRKHRCPEGYFWDDTKNKCVRRTEQNKPERPQCPEGYFWDREAGRCKRLKPDPGVCPPGYRWNPREGRCVIDRICPEGMEWRDGRCVWPDDNRCPEGFHFDSSTNKCEPNDADVNCPDGYEWDNAQKRCVPEQVDEGDGDDEEPDCPEGFHWDDDVEACVQDTGPGTPTGNARETALAFLRDNGLPESLIGFIEDAIAQRKTGEQIIAELRQRPEYLAAYPENALRAENGFSWVPETYIRAQRDEARRLAREVLGIDVSNNEIATLIGNDVSLREWEGRLRTWKAFERFGPTVRAVLESELGTRIPDDRLFAFLNSEFSTPELDRAYENALYRGRPALLGLGVRPEEEAEMLRRFGIDVDQAFRGYQGIAAEMPRTERLDAIERELNRGVDAGNLPRTGNELFNDTPFAILFRAIQLGDRGAIEYLQSQLQREVARFSTTGGIATSGGTAAGLLSREDRRSL